MLSILLALTGCNPQDAELTDASYHTWLANGSSATVDEARNTCTDGKDNDGDGVGNACDVCPGGDDGLDADGDTVPDACDACPGGIDALDFDGRGAERLTRGEWVTGLAVFLKGTRAEKVAQNFAPSRLPTHTVDRDTNLSQNDYGLRMIRLCLAA